MSLSEELERIRSKPTPPNEETAKFQIIAPLLAGLGWDPFGPDVIYEHAVGGKGGGRVDIALKGKRHLAALIEAKAPGKNLEHHVDQVLGYAFHEGVDICVLTTGLEWWLYLPREDGPPSNRRFAKLHLSKDPIEQLSEDLEAFLGKENLISKQAERRAKQVLRAQREADHLNTRLPAIWDAMVNGPHEQLVELVIQRAYEQLNLRPDREQVAAVLRGARVPTVLPAEPTAPATKATPTAKKVYVHYTSTNVVGETTACGTVISEGLVRTFEATDDVTCGSCRRTKAYQDSGEPPPPVRTKPSATRKSKTFLLWGERHEVKYWKEILIPVAEALYRRHATEFDRVLTLRGRKHPWTSRSPDILRAPVEVGASGIYLDTHFNTTDTRRRAIQLLELFGHNASDLEILYD